MNDPEDGIQLGIHWEVLPGRWSVGKASYAGDIDLYLFKKMYEKGWGNGYVDVDATHPWYGKEYHDIDVNIHGGLTYGAHQDNGLYRIGFDTAHWGDNATNCSRDYVIQEAKDLAWYAYLNQHTFISSDAMETFRNPYPKLEKYPEAEQRKFAYRAQQLLMILHQEDIQNHGGIFQWNQPTVEAMHEELFRITEHIATETGSSRLNNLVFTWRMEDTLNETKS